MMYGSWLLGTDKLSSEIKPTEFDYECGSLRIHAYRFSRRKEGEGKGPGLLSLHGRTPNTLELSGIAHKLAELGWTSYVIEARGRGKSQGDEEDREGYVDDALAALELLFKDPAVDPARVAVVGQSLGSGVAVLAGAKDKRVKAVVALHPYSRFKLPPDVPPAERPLTRPADFVADIAPRPLLIIAGEKDEKLPHAGAVELYGRAKPPKRMLTIHDGTHAIEDSESYAMGWLLTEV